MTQLFDEAGNALPATVVVAEPALVIRVKTEETDGYSAVELGYGEVKPHRLTQPVRGHFEAAGVPPRRLLREFRVDDSALLDGFHVGDQLGIEIFAVGERIDVRGISKGKGFQGVMKRWGFAGGPKSHGSHFHRRPGSIGSIAGSGRVFKGRKLPGRMGGDRVTVRNLEILKVDQEQNLLVVKGSVPGAKRSLLELRKRAGTPVNPVKQTEGSKE